MGYINQVTLGGYVFKLIDQKQFQDKTLIKFQMVTRDHKGELDFHDVDHFAKEGQVPDLQVGSHVVIAGKLSGKERTHRESGRQFIAKNILAFNLFVGANKMKQTPQQEPAPPPPPAPPTAAMIDNPGLDDIPF